MQNTVMETKRIMRNRLWN